MNYCVNVSSVFVCACLYGCVCLMFTEFVGLFVMYCVMLYVVLFCCFCMCLSVIWFDSVFACFVCNLLCDGVWLVIRVCMLCLGVSVV